MESVGIVWQSAGILLDESVATEGACDGAIFYKLAVFNLYKSLAYNMALQCSKNNEKYLEALEAKSVRALKEFRLLVFRVKLVVAYATSEQITQFTIGPGHFSTLVSVNSLQNTIINPGWQNKT